MGFQGNVAAPCSAPIAAMIMRPGSTHMSCFRPSVSVNAIYGRSVLAGPETGRERGTVVIRLYGTRVGAMFDPVRRPGVTLHAIEARPDAQGAVALEDRNMAFPVQRLADDVNLLSGIKAAVDHSPAQGRECAFCGGSVSATALVNLKSGLDVASGIGTDQFDGVCGGRGAGIDHAGYLSCDRGWVSSAGSKGLRREVVMVWCVKCGRRGMSLGARHRRYSGRRLMRLLAATRR